MIKYLKLIIIIAVFSGFGYSIYLNLKLSDYMRAQNFIILRFTDNVLSELISYDSFDNDIKGSTSYRDFIICELKSSMKYLNIDYTYAVEEMLYIENNEKDLLKTIRLKKDNLSKYLKDKQYINCDDMDMKIQKIRDARGGKVKLVN